MSLNQSRSDKNESQFRRTGSGRSGGSGQNRTFSGGSGKGGGGSTTAPTPSSSSSSLSSNRSFKKTNNVQGGQSRASAGYVNTSESNTAAAATRSTQNGSHVQSQPPLRGATDAAPNAAPKPSDPSAQKSSRPIPKAPSSHSSTINPGSVAPTTPLKASVDSSKVFPFQFGSISPGLMNGMQVPARTSSAPPNLDEQKREQARNEALRAPPAVPIPSVPKQQLPKGDVVSADQMMSSGGSHPDSKPKKDNHIKSASHQSQSQKPSVVPAAGISRPLSFHQPPVSMQFIGPNPQVQSQAMPPSSLPMQMQMQMQIGNPSQVQQQVFLPGLQHHMMPPQGMMTQAQSLGFTPQMSPHLPHQMGSMGMTRPTHFSPQQPGKFGSVRKSVRITHPETHEELRLDKRTDAYTDGASSASRTHHNALPPQPVPAYTSTHPGSYYSNPYSASPPFYSVPSSIPLTSSQLPGGSQPPRFNYPANQGPQTLSFIDHSTPNTFAVNKGGTQSPGTFDSVRSDHPKEAQSIVSPPRTSLHVTIKPAPVITDEQVTDSKLVDKRVSPNVTRPSGEPDSTHFGKDPKSKSGADHAEQHPASTTSGAVRLPETSSVELASALGNVDGGKGESVTRSETGREYQTKSGREEQSLSTHQVVGQSTAALDTVDSMRKGDSESQEAKTQGTVDVYQELDSTASDVSSDLSGSAAGGILESAGSLNSVTNQCDVEKNSLDKSKLSNDGVENVSSSLKAAQMIDATGGDADLKEMGHEGDVLGTVEREMQSVLSRPDVGELDLKGLSLDVSDSLTCVSVAGTVDQSDFSKPGMSDSEIASSTERHLETSSNHDVDAVDNHKSSLSLTPVPTSIKSSLEPNKMKNNMIWGKKKRKDILKKADDAGITSDLYMAYKAPEEKKEKDTSTDNNPTCNSENAVPADASHENVTLKEQEYPGKAEPDDWEDAADISAPKLEHSSDVEVGKMMLHGEDGVTAKTYSRDFLLTFSEHCNDLPQGFVIKPDVANILMRPHSSTGRVDREHPSPGRIVDRSSGAVRADRHGSGMMEPDRWSKRPAPLGSDLASGNMGIRPGHGNNFGVLRHPRPQLPAQYPGGILSGPIQPMVVQRNNSDSDRWRKAGNFDKSFMPSPETPMQVMHRAERKYEVGKITDEEQAKQRRLKGILNKLTPQNFEKLFEQVKAVNIDNGVTLTGVISQIFDKALMEPTFCEMYANFCHYLSSELPDLSVDNQKITFKRLLLNKCQEEFERGKREEEEANKIESEGEAKQSEEQREEKRVKARRRMLGNIRLIGELYKKRMLTERIMHECIQTLLGQNQNPDEEDVEALCKLMSTIGEMIDHSKAKDYMDAYFDIMAKLSNNMKLSSRVRFMLKDSIDLRKNRWQQRRKVEGPKKIEEVHRDAAQERQAQTSRLSRGPSMNSSMRRGQAGDFGPRGSSMISSPVGQMGSFRGLSPQFRGYAQDARMDERSAFENRTLSIPLPQRPLGGDSITLGPQGGLARGMSMRGQPVGPNVLSADISTGHIETRRMAGGLNNYSSVSERPAYNSREDLMPRLAPERFAGPPAVDQSRSHELNPSYVNRDNRNSDRNFDRARPTPFGHGFATAQNASSEKMSADKVWPEERLKEMSITTIKEFYSAKDEGEVALCLKDLNAPSCYPSVVTIWVSDSFERKDMERDLLAKLLVNLSRPQGGIFTHAQMVEGFASVLTNLEDMVTDAPRAPEFLGRLFAKAVVENVISLREIGQLLHEGGEEPGCLREAGLAGDVLGSTLESIRSEKGEEALIEIRANSHLQLEDFRPPDPLKSRKLELFI